VHDDYKDINVALQQNNPQSVLSMWKKVLKLRKEHAAVLIHGQFELHDGGNLSTFTFVKDYHGKRVLVALNFSDEEQGFEVPPALIDRKLRLLMSNIDQLQENLSAWEARVYLVE
jgi:oligo-1,6-glucosidase